MENWKQHPIYTKYEISDLGRVRTAATKKIRKTYNHDKKENGYQGIVLYQDKSHRTKLVHRLVCEVFIGFSSLEVNHKNGIKSDNRIENLEYVTHTQNMRHAINSNLFRPFASRKFGERVFTKTQNIHGYRGVMCEARSKKRPFRARIETNGKVTYLGSFATAEEAGRAYDKKAKEIFGERAILNFPE